MYRYGLYRPSDTIWDRPWGADSSEASSYSCVALAESSWGHGEREQRDRGR